MSIQNLNAGGGKMVTIQKRTLTVEEAGQYLGICRTAAYEQVRSGVIPSVRIGKRYLIPVAALERLLEATGEWREAGQK